MSKRFFLVAVVGFGSLVFFAGMAIGQATGQKATPQKFSRAAKAWTPTLLDLQLLWINNDLLRDAVGKDQDGIGVPQVYFDYEKRRVEAWVSVDADKLERLPAEKLNRVLMLKALQVMGSANRLAGPESESLSNEDFFMEFKGFAVGRAFEQKGLGGKGYYEFYAVFENGELSIRSKVPRPK